MPSRDVLPLIRSTAEMQELYRQLSSDKQPYYKTMVRVFLRAGGSFEETVVHSDKEHFKLTRSGHIGAIEVKPIEVLEHGTGRRYLRSFVEFTRGGLYSAYGPGNTGVRFFGPEWALNFKVDCDLARRKTGSIDDAIAHYISDFVVANQPFLQAQRKKLERMKKRRQRQPDMHEEIQENKNFSSGRPRKSNSEDLLERYGDNPEAAEWIRQNSDKLNASDEFYHEEYRTQDIANGTTLDEVGDDRNKYLDTEFN